MPITKPIAKPVAKPVAKPELSRPPVRPAPKPVAPAKATAKPAKENGERATKSLSIRMPPDTLEMLDNAVASYESDRTEVVKRAIRLLSTVLSGHNACVTVTDADGNKKDINLVIDGVPV